MNCTFPLRRAALLAAFTLVSLLFSTKAFAHFGGEGVGENNRASGFRAVVGGGKDNSASGGRATVSGGALNRATGFFSTVAGGARNRAGATGASVGGGSDNLASGLQATVSGGFDNVASGEFATVAGGQDNAATNSAYAAGSHAKAIHRGAFVWADSQGADFSSSGINSFDVRAAGGVRFTTADAFRPEQTVRWRPGFGSWEFTSDAATKEAFRKVDAREVLRRVAALPVKEWNYIGYADQRHIGPTAQDWHAAFPLNRSDKTLNTADLHGVSLVAIQGLVEELKERDKTIKELKAKSAKVDSLESKNEDLTRQIEAIQKRLDSLPPAP